MYGLVIGLSANRSRMCITAYDMPHHTGYLALGQSSSIIIFMWQPTRTLPMWNLLHQSDIKIGV